jgi:hypothetical protein
MRKIDYLKPIGMIGLLLSGVYSSLFAQKWVDESYQINTKKNIPYGVARNFAGREDTLHFDISYPVDDTVPECGRPLLIAVHGGAFIRGSRTDGLPVYWRESFARRGYTTASVQYRLGVFPEDRYINCNVDAILNTEWNCSNFTDTLEWFRAIYRAQQDVKGCIRYLVNHKDEYQINPQQIYLIGESAGAYTVLNVGFLDDPSEKLWMNGAIDSVPRPNNLYENRCLLNPGLSGPIDQMDLSRPDLGGIDGDLNPDAEAPRIKGVAGFYGGIVQDIFSKTSNSSVPILYLFHQPADLIVPFNYGLILAGINDFFAGSFGCQQVVNRPFTLGSKGIMSLIDSLHSENKIVPQTITHFTNNYATAWEQFLDPSKTGHAVQDYRGTANEVAAFFAPHITEGGCTNAIRKPVQNTITIFPNPASDVINIDVGNTGHYLLRIFDCMGRMVTQTDFDLNRYYNYSVSNLSNGIYTVWITAGNQLVNQSKLIIIK